MHDAHDSDRLTLTVAEAARCLGIGRNTAYEAARLGSLPTIRIGRRLLVPRVALETLLANAAALPGPLDPVPSPSGVLRPGDGPRHRG